MFLVAKLLLKLSNSYSIFTISNDNWKSYCAFHSRLFFSLLAVSTHSFYQDEFRTKTLYFEDYILSLNLHTSSIISLKR